MHLNMYTVDPEEMKGKTGKCDQEWDGKTEQINFFLL